MTPNSPRRRWFQFSTMLMLLLVTLVAVLFAWRSAINEGRRIERSYKRADLVKLLEHQEGQRTAVLDPSLEHQISKAREALEKFDHQ